MWPPMAGFGGCPYGAMMGGGNPYGGNAGYNPYGGAKAKGKGKAKGFGKDKGPKIEKPLVNPNQINPAKGMYAGGISFKNILQEKISKQISRAIAPQDIVYTCVRVKGGRMCTLTLPCMGTEGSYEGETPAVDDKAAGQQAASKALEALFPEVFAAVLEAYNGAQAGGLATGSEGDAGELAGATPTVDPEGEPKGLLNSRVPLVLGRPIQTGDIVYETKWKPQIQGYACTLRLNCLEGGFTEVAVGTQVFEGEAPGHPDKRMAEKAAARMALEANKESFDQAKMGQEMKKARQEAAKKGFGKGSSKGFGKGKGKGKGFAFG